MRAALVAAALVAVGCTSYPADRDYDYRGHTAAEIPLEKVPVHGFPVQLVLEHQFSPWSELLAIDRDTVWLETKDGIVKYARDDLRSVMVQVMRPNDNKSVAAWAGLSNLVSGGHGWFGFASGAVFWVIAAVLLTSAVTDNAFRIEPRFFDFLAQYARFPQGLPPSLAPRARAAVTPPPAPPSPRRPPASSEEAGLPMP